MPYMSTPFERPLEDDEARGVGRYTPAITNEQEDALQLMFVKEHAKEFVDFVKGLDGTILYDFIYSCYRYEWKERLEEERYAEAV